MAFVVPKIRIGFLQNLISCGLFRPILKTAKIHPLVSAKRGIMQSSEAEKKRKLYPNKCPVGH